MKIVLKSIWNKLKGETKIICSKLLDDDLLRMEGEKYKLIAKLHQHYYNPEEYKNGNKYNFYVKNTHTRDDYH